MECPGRLPIRSRAYKRKVHEFKNKLLATCIEIVLLIFIWCVVTKRSIKSQPAKRLAPASFFHPPQDVCSIKMSLETTPTTTLHHVLPVRVSLLSSVCCSRTRKLRFGEIEPMIVLREYSTVEQLSCSRYYIFVSYSRARACGPQLPYYRILFSNRSYQKKVCCPVYYL